MDNKKSGKMDQKLKSAKEAIDEETGPKKQEEQKHYQTAEKAKHS